MGAKLFVGNLNPRTTERQLERFFSSAGMAVSVSIPIDPRSGRSRGFGFVHFEERDQAERALTVFDGRELGGRPLHLSWARELPPGELARRRGSGEDGAARFRRAAPGRRLEDYEEASSNGERDDYAMRVQRSRRGGKHGSDRRRAHGTRRQID